jgi:voltage-gated potassium channel
LIPVTWVKNSALIKLPSMKALLASPWRNLVFGALYMLVVMAISMACYVEQGWSLGDALYMVVLTIYTVGYGEVRPLDTPTLRAITIGQIVFGCTGMIFLTGALVQFFTLSQLQQLFGIKRMKSQIGELEGHVIICGFGRIGVMLAQELKVGRVPFVILERSSIRFEQARDLGHLTLQGDATDETSLQAAGIARARVLATVLPDDAANVFITLSARSLNPQMQIIARGEAPSTENKLIYAGANRVVLPTHIGAERIAEIILFPEMAKFTGSERMQGFEKEMRMLGLYQPPRFLTHGGFPKR